MHAQPQYRELDIAPFAAAAEQLVERSLGKPPVLKWIPIRSLVVDPVYQREIGGTGRKNIARIAREFDWAKFAPVIVAPAGGGRFVIVDGQHRTIAARLCGLECVPCQIIDADRALQAAAFAAINANITEMSPMQVHAAKLAAQDPDALRLASLCAKAGITILRYPVQTKNHKAGDTMAVGMLYRMLAKFGDDVLEAALSCITRTRDGYPGLVRSQLVTAFCVNLEASADWREHRKLLKVIGKLDLRELFHNAGRTAKSGSSGGIVAALVDAIGEHLEKELG
jgi:hypothetical protein